MGITEREVVDDPAVQAVLNEGKVDGIGVILAGAGVHLAVADCDADARGRLQRFERLADQVVIRALGKVRRANQLHAGCDLDGLRVCYDVNIVRAGLIKDRIRHQRVVVAGQDIDRHRQALEHLRGAGEDFAREGIVLKDVAGHDYEVRARVLSQLSQPDDGGLAVIIKATLGLALQEPPGHAQLKIGGMDKRGSSH